MKHISIVMLLVFLLTASCDTGSQLVDHRHELELVFPFDAVDSGHVGVIPSVLKQQPDGRVHAAFESIQQYECAAVLYSNLGKPIVQGKELPSHSFQMETLYDDKRYYPIDQYVVWLNGDKLYCFGFNENGEVISKRVFYRTTIPGET